MIASSRHEIRRRKNAKRCVFVDTRCVYSGCATGGIWGSNTGGEVGVSGALVYELMALYVGVVRWMQDLACSG